VLQVLINEALDGLCEDALKKAIDQSGVKAVGQASLQVRKYLHTYITIQY
jgi:hypothetical protein